MITDERLARLLKPADFARANPRYFRGPASMRYMIEWRAINGLVETGAVLETRAGVLIDPDAFREWWLTPATRAA